MIYEGVNFIEAGCRKMTRDAFVKAHKDLLWLDRDEATRKKMLEKAYELIKPSTKKEK